MTLLKLNQDGLKIYLDYLEYEKKELRILKSYFTYFSTQIQSLDGNDISCIERHLETLNKLEENINGRIDFLEGLIRSQYELTEQISAINCYIKRKLEFIDEEN